MAKTPRVNLRLDPDVVADLDLLATAKVYGSNHTEVAERFVTQKLAELVESGEFDRVVSHRKKMKGVEK